ncbi:MAG: DUF2341 domain-containing protein [Chitinispirillaceae bacterium]|nr:DUF2341 domain-containing protein [Chitinispirillaceae bacterium]
MNNRSRTVVYLITVVMTVCFLRCTPDPVSGGGTIETTNGVVGSVRYADETPAPNSIVRLFRENYNPVVDGAPDTRFTDTADTDGIYRFSDIAPGTYTVIARNQETATGFLERDVEVFDDSVTTVGDGLLEGNGFITVDFSSGGMADGDYVYIPGTDLSAPVNGDGSVVFGAIPPGTFSTLLLSSDRGGIRNLLRETITVVSGDTTVIELPLWNHCRKLVLNTTSAGAGISGDVNGFPVLVRLSAASFDFSQADGSGRDIRFTSPDGKVLSHETEQWDSTGERAALWVRVDTVYGNDSTQFIMMYWDNPAAVDGSHGDQVFDTTMGFQGVWHLSGYATDSAVDATGNGYNGISPDTCHPAAMKGIAGDCRGFDGVGDYITMPNTADSRLDFPEEGQYTVSAWIKLDTLDGEPHLIVAKGFTQYFMRFTYFPSDSASWEFAEFSEAGRWQACTTPAASGQWAQLVGVREGSRQLLYCNGVLVDSVPNIYPNSDFSRDVSNDLSIGKFLIAVEVQGVVENSYCFFKGSIDEVRIASSARSSGWVRLCYMNQRPDDRLVIFK